MPAPLAHGAVAFLGVPLVGQRPAAEPRLRTLLVVALVVFACGAPDLDLIVGLLLIGDPFTHHGAFSHSLLAAPVFGGVFACLLRWLRPTVTLGRAWAVGAGLYAVHVCMDALIYDTRGAALLWPILSDRFASPIVLFVGVEYGQWWRWDLHMLTLANEAAFAVVMWWLSVEWRRRRRSIKDGINDE
ncbi:MAG: metal-dependent hydrolase [Planctomycetota bacterium]